MKKGLEKIITEILLGILGLLGFIYYYLSRNKNYWHDRKIPSTRFKLFYGDDEWFIKQNDNIHDMNLRLYKQFEDVPFYGGWTMLGHTYLMN